MGGFMISTKYITLTNGFLYVYAKPSSRRSEYFFPIVNMRSCLVDTKDENKFKVNLKKNCLTFTCEDKWICEKWVNSIKYVFDNLGEYIGHENIGVNAMEKEERYRQLGVYQKVTGKTCYKDYEVICEQYE